MGRQWSIYLSKVSQVSALALGVSLLTTPAHAALQFQFEYTDSGVGFNDPVSGAQRRLALEKSGQRLAAFFPSLNATIRLSVDGSVTEDSTLASAGSSNNSSCNPGFQNLPDVSLIALGGQDPDPNSPDGNVSVNFEDVVWDLDDTVDPGAFDFISTMMHELLHALGFSGSLGQTPADACGTTEPSPGSFDPFDKYVGDFAGPIINNTTAVIDSARWLNTVVGGTGTAGLQWHGENGKAANGGEPIPIYSPTTYSVGSTGSHLDDDFYANAAYMMEAATDTGQGIRVLSAFTIGIMKDIGYPALGASSADDSDGDGIANALDPYPNDATNSTSERLATAWRVGEVYLATLGRAMDAEGLAYWADQVDNDLAWTPETVAQSFFDQPEVQALYPSSASTGDFVTALYQNVLGRAPDTAGFDYWVSQIDGGILRRDQMVIAMINGAWGNQTAFSNGDVARFRNRTLVASAFATYQTSNGIKFSALSDQGKQQLLSASSTVLANVTADAATVATATNSIASLLQGL